MRGIYFFKLIKVARERPLEKVSFERRPESDTGISHVEMREEQFQVERTANRNLMQ